MSTPATMPRIVLRVLVAVLVLLGVVWATRAYWSQRQRILAENRAVELQNQEQYREAVRAYEVLLPEAGGDQARRLRQNLAACYVALAEDPELASPDSLELYRKAYALDPTAVTNPAVIKRLEEE